MIDRRQFLAVSAVAAGGHLLHATDKVTPPAAYGATPSELQLRWHRLETYSFLHFTVNTFTDKEWGYGDEDPNVFFPTDFDPDSIVRDLKAGGMKAVILTCKHHDGFCLWPTKTTEHCIRNSRWRDGKGDVVRDIADAARREGLLFGVYVSPWDRANPKYGTPDYLPVYREQVRELMTNYGPIFEAWFDGANGGDGYYGGAREKRSIDRDHYYEWPKTLEIVRRLQPNAVIFGAEGGDIRWVGDESGVAGDPCWATYDPPDMGTGAGTKDVHASVEEDQSRLMTGVRNGPLWMPAECDVSIRPGWFWHESQNAEVKTPEQLVDLYFKSVGRGASLLLNLPPNREGRIQKEDAASVARFHKELERMFAVDLAVPAKLQPSNVRAGDRRFGANNLVDRDSSTYWATDDSETRPSLTIDLGTPRKIAVLRLREAIQLGQRIRAFSFDVWGNDAWQEVAAGTSVGSCRLLRLTDQPTTSRLRLRITESDACIALSELGIF